MDNKAQQLVLREKTVHILECLENAKSYLELNAGKASLENTLSNDHVAQHAMTEMITLIETLLTRGVI